jgi:transposase
VVFTQDGSAIFTNDVPQAFTKDVPVIFSQNVPLSDWAKTDYPSGETDKPGGAMSERRLKLMDIREMLRHIRDGRSDRQVGKDLGVDRRTVKRYREWAQCERLLEGDLPDHENLLKILDLTMPEKVPPQNSSKADPYRCRIKQLLEEKVKVTAIYDRLKEDGYTGSYASVLRLARQIEPRKEEAYVRKECQPGEEAEVDFGYVGMMYDDEGNLRKTWAFVMVLGWSRYAYVEFVFDQKVATWLSCHRNALTFFGGVPQRLVIDNLKSGITQAVWDNPQVQISYRECAEHYGFLILPCRPATPEHKGKVEGGVGYVKGRFMGGRGPLKLAWANQEVRKWCRDEAGMRIHGTTKQQPRRQFEQVERGRLKPLPQTPYDIAIWKKVRLYHDCHVEFDGSYYSAPFRLIKHPLRVCAGTRLVRIFDEKYALIATHERAAQPGTRRTHRDHYPPEKLPGLERTREGCLAQAIEFGPAVQRVVEDLLADPVLDQIHQVGRLLRLSEKYGIQRLCDACQRALDFGDPAYKTVKNILKHNLDQQDPPISIQLAPAHTFSRQPDELVGNLAEVASWN